MKFRLFATGLILLTTRSLFAEEVPDYFTQPTEVPDQREWETGAQPLPPIADIVAKPAQPFPVYGIYLWGDEYQKAHAEIEKMGVRSIRLSGPTSEAEEALLIAAEKGVEVMFTVSNATERERKKGVRWNRPAYESDEAYLEAMSESFNGFLDEYGPNGALYAGTGFESPIRAIEILNEPNYQYMIPDRMPREEVEAEREALYAKVLPMMSEIIYSHPNTLPIVGFSCGGGGATRADFRFVEGVYEKSEAGLHETYDIFSTHPYMKGAPPEAYKIKSWGPVAMSKNLAEMRAFLSEQGAEKPVWFTEVGWEIGHEYGGRYDVPDKRKPEMLTPELHGAFVVRMYLWAMRLGVERVFIMHLHDTDNYNGGLMTRSSLKWRPAAFAIQNLIQRMPNPKLIAALSDGEGDSYIYEFISDYTQDSPNHVVVAWNVLGPTEVEIPVSGTEIKIYDMVGNEKVLPVLEGKVKVTIGPYPLYIDSVSAP